jgi:hypothetical protein
VRPERKADLTAICEPTVCLTTLWASTACCKDSFTFFTWRNTSKKHSSPIPYYHSHALLRLRSAFFCLFIYVFMVCLATLPVTLPIWRRMIGWLEKMWKEWVVELFKILSRNLHCQTEETHKKPQARHSTLRISFEPSTSWIQIKRVSAQENFSSSIHNKMVHGIYFPPSSLHAILISSLEIRKLQ